MPDISKSNDGHWVGQAAVSKLLHLAQCGVGCADEWSTQDTSTTSTAV